MRRKDRRREEPAFFDYVFNTAETLSLALDGGEFPCCLPMNFVRLGARIYIHSAKEGRKLNLIRANPHAAFCLACDIRIDREKSSTYYKSICGRGLASIVEDAEEKRAALDALALRYNALCPRPAPDANVRRVAIIRVDILEMSGKECSPEGRGAAQAAS